MQYCWFPSTFRLLLRAKHDSERERGLWCSMWEEDSCLCQAGSLAFQHTLCTTDIQWLQEEIDHLKKQRQIFDLDYYPAGVSSSSWCLELLIIFLPFMRILLWILTLCCRYFSLFLSIWPLDQFFKERPLMGNTLCWRREGILGVILTEELVHLISYWFLPSRTTLVFIMGYLSGFLSPFQWALHPHVSSLISSWSCALT